MDILTYLPPYNPNFWENIFDRLNYQGKPIVINLLGGPGCGKSTLAHYLTGVFKMLRISTEYAPEYAKTLIFFNKEHLLVDQDLVSTTQMEILDSLKSKTAVIITDGPLYHGLVYNEINTKDPASKREIERKILNKIKEFNNFNIFVERLKGYEFDNNNRVHSEEQSLALDDLVMNMVLKHDIIHVKTTPTSATVPLVLNCIINTFTKKAVDDESDYTELTSKLSVKL